MKKPLIWKNTPTLDAYSNLLSDPVSSNEAEFAVIGGKSIEIEKFPKLKGLFKCGVGVDNVPFEACKSRGIKIGLPSERTADSIYQETADYTVSLIYRMIYADAGNLENWKKYPRKSFSDQRLLIVGRGKIGSRVARILKNQLRVDTYDILENSPEHLNQLIPEADLISIHVPLNAETTSFFDSTKLSLMQDGACLINTARGAIVDEMALLKEIKSGRIRAAFDVFWEEPYHGPLREFHPDCFFMSPHIASISRNFLTGLADDLEVFIEATNSL